MKPKRQWLNDIMALIGGRLIEEDDNWLHGNATQGCVVNRQRGWSINE